MGGMWTLLIAGWVAYFIGLFSYTQGAGTIPILACYGIGVMLWVAAIISGAIALRRRH